MPLIIALSVILGLIVILSVILFLMSKFFFGRGREYDPTRILKDNPELANEIVRYRETLKKYTPEKVEMTSYDGLRLTARIYYASEKTDRFVVCMHGYHSGGEGDFSGAVEFFIKNRFNVLIATQRCHGDSEGRRLTFGVKEKYDCRDWCKYLVSRFGGDIKIVLDGVSMGATTVMMASDRKAGLPENVKGIIADCGYTSPWEIVCDVAKKAYRLPKFPILYLFRLVVMLDAGFDLKAESAETAVKNTDIPIFFAHGTGDDFVPYEMSLRNSAACSSDHMLFSAEGAGHGLSFIVDNDGYTRECMNFLEKHLK